MFEINTMLYLAQLLSLYDGNPPAKWGYSFTKNKFGAPISIEIFEEIASLCSKNYLVKDDSGYYRLSDISSTDFISELEKSYLFEWKTKYIMTALDSLLTKPFPKVVNAIQYEPGINLLDKINRTNVLLDGNSISLLFDDFKIIKELINDANIDLLVPASLWIDYLAVQAQQED